MASCTTKNGGYFQGQVTPSPASLRLHRVIADVYIYETDKDKTTTLRHVVEKTIIMLP